MKKSVLTILTLLFGITYFGVSNISAAELTENNNLISGTKIYEKSTLTSEEESHCASSIFDNIGSITKNKYVKINGVNNPLYCTFTNQNQALENIKLETSNLLTVLSNEYDLDSLNSSNWKEYQSKMNEFFTIPTDDYNESNEEFIKLRAFFDIYENEEANQKILNYVNKQKLNAKNSNIETSKSIDTIELGLLFPSYAPIAKQAESKLVRTQTKATINIQPAVDYAIAHATNRNTPTYYSFSNGDCTNFVSQILEASGVSQIVYSSEHSGWWHKRQAGFLGIGWKHTHSRSWTMADVFARYMGVTYTTQNHPNFSANILKGDFIAADWSSDGNWDHSGFVTEKDNYASSWNGSPAYYDYKVAQHTSDYHAWTSSSTNNWENTSDGRTYARVRR